MIEPTLRPPPHKGAYIFPNLLTAGNLFAGFYAIVTAMNLHFERAAVAIIIAAFMDGLDGKIARMTGTSSRFGVEFDSLADLVSFGVAPALLVYIFELKPFARIGWVAAFLFVVCGALRLARFNTQVETADKRYFQGLPSPAAAAILAGFIWICLEYGYDIEVFKYFALVLTISTGLLMVSNFRYSSFKEIDLKGKVPFVMAIAVMLGIAFVMAQPQIMLFLLFLAYAISGPEVTLVMRKRRWLGRKS